MIPGSGRSPGEGNGNLFHILAWRISWTEDPGRLSSPWGPPAEQLAHSLSLKERKKIKHEFKFFVHITRRIKKKKKKPWVAGCKEKMDLRHVNFEMAIGHMEVEFRIEALHWKVIRL